MRTAFALVAFVVAFAMQAAKFDCSLEPPSKRQQDHLLWSYTPLLSDDEAQRINAKLVQFARETSDQILVLVVDTLCGTDAGDLAFQVGQRWGIGKKEFDNGIVFLIKPNGTAGQRKVFIATGYGLEGPIPDATCKQIIENVVVPNFKMGQYYAGIDQALDVLMGLAKGEIDHKSYGHAPIPWMLLLFAGLFIVFMIFNFRRRVRKYSRTNGIDFWTAMLLLNSMSGRRGGSSSGFRGFGGGGGGGFGGFGGGGFGGGGAGGSW